MGYWGGESHLVSCIQNQHVMPGALGLDPFHPFQFHLAGKSLRCGYQLALEQQHPSRGGRLAYGGCWDFPHYGAPENFTRVLWVQLGLSFIFRTWLPGYHGSVPWLWEAKSQEYGKSAMRPGKTAVQNAMAD